MRALILSLVLLALGGCGFHLRGEAKIAPSLARAHVDPVDVNSPLKRDLEAALARAGVTIAASDAAVIKLPVMQLATEPLTVGRTARVQEYRIRFRVELEIVDASGKTLLARTPIELTRDYSFDEQQALGAKAEEDLLKVELEREMVQQILRRIETVSG